MTQMTARRAAWVSIAALGSLLIGCSTSNRTETVEQNTSTNRVVALDPLCDLAVLPDLATPLYAQKDIIEASYNVSEAVGESDTATVTVKIWGQPGEQTRASQAGDAVVLKRRLLVKDSRWGSFGEWTSCNLDLLPKGNEPHVLTIRGLGGKRGCKVSLSKPGITGQDVVWRNGRTAQTTTVSASTDRDRSARFAQVKASEDRAAGEDRDVLRIRAKEEVINVYILPPADPDAKACDTRAATPRREAGARSPRGAPLPGPSAARSSPRPRAG